MSKKDDRTTVGEKHMTPYQKVLWLIIAEASELEGGPADNRKIKRPPFPCSNIESLYDELMNNPETENNMQDGRNEAAYCGEETCVATPYSRHYEPESRALKFPDGTWVGWTRWFGGGKHGCPQNIEWECDAYDLSLVKEEEVVTVRRVFEKKTENGEENG